MLCGWLLTGSAWVNVLFLFLSSTGALVKASVFTAPVGNSCLSKSCESIYWLILRGALKASSANYDAVIGPCFLLSSEMAIAGIRMPEDTVWVDSGADVWTIDWAPDCRIVFLDCSTALDKPASPLRESLIACFESYFWLSPCFIWLTVVWWASLK